jgi:hypothetical protein
MFCNFATAALQHMETGMAHEKDAHERMATDFNAPIGVMQNLSNLVDIDGKGNLVSSGHAHLRDAFISFAQLTRKDRLAFSSTKKMLQDKDDGFRNDFLYLTFLSDDLWHELQAMLRDNKMETHVSKNDLPPYLLSVAPVSEQSAAKWQIEKRYLNHWLSKARDGTLKKPDEDGQFFIPWVTDGARIASCYKRNWM